MALAYGTFFGNVVLLPLWLQQYMGYTATCGRHRAGAGRAFRDPADAAAWAATCTRVDLRVLRDRCRSPSSHVVLLHALALQHQRRRSPR